MNKITDDQWIKLYDLKKEMSRVAVHVGPLHCFWDYISDIDRIMQNKKPLCDVNSLDEFIAELKMQLRKQKESK